MDVFDAIEDATLDDVRRLLTDDPQAVNSNDICSGGQPLHVAAWLNKPDILEELLAHGANINGLDLEGRTPLHHAALHGWEEPARRLVRHQPLLSLVDKHGFTPLVYAIRTRTPEGKQIAELLLMAGAEYDLHAAAATPDPARVQEILRCDPDAVQRVPNQGQLLIDALISSTGTGQVSAQVLVEPLFAHGLQVDQNAIEEIAAGFHDKRIGTMLRRLTAKYCGE